MDDSPQVAGWTKDYERIHLVTVRGAGHMVCVFVEFFRLTKQKQKQKQKQKNKQPIIGNHMATYTKKVPQWRPPQALKLITYFVANKNL